MDDLDDWAELNPEEKTDLRQSSKEFRKYLRRVAYRDCDGEKFEQ